MGRTGSFGLGMKIEINDENVCKYLKHLVDNGMICSLKNMRPIACLIGESSLPSRIYQENV